MRSNRVGPTFAQVAQLGERQTEDLNVPGSSPGLGILLPSNFGQFTNSSREGFSFLFEIGICTDNRSLTMPFYCLATCWLFAIAFSSVFFNTHIICSFIIGMLFFAEAICGKIIACASSHASYVVSTRSF